MTNSNSIGGIVNPELGVPPFQLLWSYEVSTKTLYSVFVGGEDERTFLRTALERAPELIINPSLLALLLIEQIIYNHIRRELEPDFQEIAGYITTLDSSLKESAVNVDATYLISATARMTYVLDAVARFLWAMERLEVMIEAVVEFRDCLQASINSDTYSSAAEDSFSQRMTAVKVRLHGAKVQANLTKTQAQAYLQTVCF